MYAPVLIITLCRYEHFKRCIESLARCAGADQTEVFIGLDYPKDESHWPGYRQILEYIDTIQGFKEVHIYKRDVNYGPVMNVKDLRMKIRDRFDRHIYTEDDNEFSPNFLEYMNQCLEKYQDNPRVAAICGYSYREWEDVKDYPFNAYPLQGFCPWGIGLWDSKEEGFRSFMDSEEILKSKTVVKQLFRARMYATVHHLMSRRNRISTDLRRRCYYILQNMYCIFPTKSKVRNLGFDGSGVTCSVREAFNKQQIDMDPTFTLDDFEIRDYPQIKSLYKIKYSLSPIQRLLVRFEYFQYRITGKPFREYALIKKLMGAHLSLVKYKEQN